MENSACDVYVARISSIARLTKRVAPLIVEWLRERTEYVPQQ